MASKIKKQRLNTARSHSNSRLIDNNHLRNILKCDKSDELQKLITDKHITNIDMTLDYNPCHSLIMIACLYGSIECVKVLISNKANINYKLKIVGMDTETILKCACLSGKLELIEYIVANGAEITDITIYGCLRSLISIPDLNIVKYLVHNLPTIESQTHYDNRGLISLINLSSEIGRLDVILFVLEHTKDKPVIQASVTSAFNTAASRGHIHILDYFIDNSNKIINQDTINYALIYACNKNQLNIVKYLFTKGAKIGKNTGHESILGKCIRKGYFKIAKLLIVYGANVNDSIDDQRSILYLTCEHNKFHMVKLLIKYGVKIIDDDPDYPLLRTCYSNIKLIKLLLQNGADPDVLYDRGSPLLDSAECCGSGSGGGRGGRGSVGLGRQFKRDKYDDYDHNNPSSDDGESEEADSSENDEADSGSSDDEGDGGQSGGADEEEDGDNSEGRSGESDSKGSSETSADKVAKEQGNSGDGGGDGGEESADAEDSDDDDDDDLMTVLLQYNANVNITDPIFHETTLMKSALALDIYHVKLLLRYGADVTLVNTQGHNVLQLLAIRYNNIINNNANNAYNTNIKMQYDIIVKLCMKYIDKNCKVKQVLK